MIEGLIPANPADAVARPKVAWEGQRRTVVHPLEFAALLTAARAAGGTDHALVALLGMIGLRVSETCHADIDDIRYQGGYEILHVLGTGAKPADIPLPIPVLRAVRDATGGRDRGPILPNTTGRRLDGSAAARRLRRLASRAGIGHPISPHSLRRTFCTTGQFDRRRPDPGHADRDAAQRPSHHHPLRPRPTLIARPPTPSPPTCPA